MMDQEVTVDDLTLTTEEMAELLTTTGNLTSRPMWVKDELSDDQRQQLEGAAKAIAATERRDRIEAYHPLLKFLPLTGEPKPPEWIVPGFIEEGIVSIAGQAGAGKTSSLFPLAAIVAGLIQSPLSPGRLWRPVVYASEHPAQVERIAAGLVLDGLVDPKLLDERVKVVQATRMPSGELVLAGELLFIKHLRTVDGQQIKPLVVLDTRSACIEQADENSTSEGSLAVADLKTRFAGLPVWVVTHVSKANLNRSDVENLTARGASSWEADANQTLFLVVDAGERWLVNSKTRFEPLWRELQMDSRSRTLTVKNRFGDDEVLTLRYSIPTVPAVTRSELAASSKADAKAQAHGDLREQVLDTLRATQALGGRLNATSLRERIGRRAADVSAAIGELMDEQWLIEVVIQPNLRADPRRSKFLYALTTEQHDRVIGGEPMPPEAKEIPPDWQKEPVQPFPT